MTIRYLLWELNINKKFARDQKVTWEQKKEYIFKIMQQIAEKKLFGSGDKTKDNYNLVDDYEDSSSLCMPKFNGDDYIIKSNLLNDEENNVLQDAIEESKVKERSFMYSFNLGLVSHQDATLLKEGTRTKLWSVIPETNAGILYETPFGIIVSNKLQKIVIIKKSASDFSTLGLPELTDYLSEKSYTYKAIDTGSDYRIKIFPFIKDREFDPEDIVSLLEIDLDIDANLVKDYRKKTGKNDLFFNLIKNIKKDFGNSKNLGLNIKYAEEGDQDAIEVFREIYSSFTQIQGEEIERIFNKFKIDYEKRSGGKGHVNFKINKAYRYENVNETKTNFENIFEAFKDLRRELNEAN